MQYIYVCTCTCIQCEQICMHANAYVHALIIFDTDITRMYILIIYFFFFFNYNQYFDARARLI